MGPTQRILVIDDDRDMGEFIADAAKAKGLECAVTSDAFSFLTAFTPDTRLIIMDLLMPEVDGIELLRRLAELKCTAGIVLMSGIDKRVIETAEQLAAALGLSIVGRLRKPFGLAKLAPILRWYQEHPVPISTERQASAPIYDEDLWRAVEENEFVVYFQPQISFARKEVVGVEALVRWNHPKYGLIFPDHFIARAEALNIIDQLGWSVIYQGLGVLRRFADKNGEIPSLSVNVSPLSLRDLDFPDKLADLLRKNKIPAEKLVLEVTESGVVKDLARTLDVLTRFRMKGVKLSIDDFGTGYSMLQQLKRIPATELKIDESFVQTMLINDCDRVMVQKTIEIGHELAMTVVAEGVETQEQFDWLLENKCDVAQGYLFSRPLQTDKIVKWLAKYRLNLMSPVRNDPI